MPFLSNFQNTFCVFNYLPYSIDNGDEPRLTHPKPLIAVLYSLYAGAVGRANAFAAYLALERVYHCRSRFIMRVFQWMLNFIVFNTYKIYIHLSDLVGTSAQIDVFYKRLLVGMRCLAWGSSHFHHSYCSQNILEKWLINHNIWENIPTTTAKCSQCDNPTTCLTCARVSGVFACFCHNHVSTHHTLPILLSIEDLSLSHTLVSLQKTPNKSPCKR